MLKLAVLGVMLVGSVSAANAVPITGTISLTGDDTFTSSTLSFFDTFIGGGPGANTGAFSVLTNGNLVTPFPGSSQPISYSQGQHTLGSPLETIMTTEAGETFAFFITDYNANFFTKSAGCMGQSCLSITGDGYFTGTGVVNYDQTPGSFTFTTQLAPGQSSTTLSASGLAMESMPEPDSLALVGTGFFGIVALARYARRRIEI